MIDSPNADHASVPKPSLARQLGLFDATMLVMGGIVGSGIFINPYVVAQQVHTPALILAAWILGGIVGVIGAFIWAELAATLPAVGGQYAYLREAYHPGVAFLYGWVLLLVIQTGGMAAVSITFARYFVELTGLQARDWVVATAALATLTFINCLGVKTGGRTQSALMVMKIVAVSALMIAGLALTGRRVTITTATEREWSLTSFGAAMVPVLFAYGGWQTANFLAAEVKEPKKNLPRGLLLGVLGVGILYIGVNWVYLRSLGPRVLAATTTPATAVMRMALGQQGAKFIAAAIAISTLGFLSQSILTAPRVYFAMAEDGLFFRAIAWLDPRTRVPVVAIVLQSVWTVVIALSGRYEEILNYVVSMDFLFFGLTATTIFVFRKRAARGEMNANQGYRVPGHPVSTAMFVAICWWVVANTVYRYPQNSLIGFVLLLAGIPAYWFWSRRARLRSTISESGSSAIGRIRHE
ncbi:MAG TPA: amino acid permease [Candidatus Dormibacteraeota bacterium]|nr:amino acid permease [Candidatus Dormibacteraeota bacterium]